MALAWVVILPLCMCPMVPSTEIMTNLYKGLKKGLGLHVQDVTWLTVKQANETAKLLLFIGELVYASALFFGKASILCFYWRMFRVSNIKLPIQILLAASVIWIVIRVCLEPLPLKQSLILVDLHGNLPLRPSRSVLEV